MHRSRRIIRSQTSTQALPNSPGREVDVRLPKALAQVVVQREHVVLHALFDPQPLQLAQFLGKLRSDVDALAGVVHGVVQLPRSRGGTQNLSVDDDGI